MSTSKTNPIADLTDEQIDTLREVFLVFDQDGNETIHIKDLSKAMRDLGQNPTEAEMKAIIEEIDADGNGVVEFSEFVDLMARRPWGMQGSREELVDAFSVFTASDQDHEHGDYVLASEVRRALTTLGEKLTDEELDQMFSQLVLDGDGRVDYNEMVDIILENPSNR